MKYWKKNERFIQKGLSTVYNYQGIVYCLGSTV